MLGNFTRPPKQHSSLSPAKCNAPQYEQTLFMGPSVNSFGSCSIPAANPTPQSLFPLAALCLPPLRITGRFGVSPSQDSFPLGRLLINFGSCFRPQHVSAFRHWPIFLQRVSKHSSHRCFRAYCFWRARSDTGSSRLDAVIHLPSKFARVKFAIHRRVSMHDAHRREVHYDTAIATVHLADNICIINKAPIGSRMQHSYHHPNGSM